MTEQLALHQGLSEHRAVQGKKRALHAPRVAVHERGGQLFAGARLPLDQHRCLGAGGKLHGLQCREKGPGAADHALIVPATLLADGNLLHQLAVVRLAVFEDEREPLHAHLVDVSTPVLMGMDVKTGMRCVRLADAFDRALLVQLVAGARVTVGDLVTASAQHLGQAGAVCLEEGAVGRDDPGILVDNQEGSLVGLRDGLQVGLGGHSAHGSCGRGPIASSCYPEDPRHRYCLRPNVPLSRPDVAGEILRGGRIGGLWI